MRWFILLTALLVAAPLSACLNDRDSRRKQQEARPDDPMKGLPPIPNVLRGRFDRYPEVYYEMRRDRILAELERDPNQLELYDDLAVSLDHLGDDTAAIQWMDRKLELIEAAPDKTTPEWHEQWYSYHANQGTFYAHDWIHAGADRTEMSGLLKARDLIAKAIEIKPEAHFGREKYQLMALDWIASGPEFGTDGEMPNMLGLSMSEIAVAGSNALIEKQLSDAVQGLSGLIVLGAAWESVDATYALGIALRLMGDSDNAFVALLRCKELLSAGRKSFVKGLPTGERLVAMLQNVLTAPEDKDRAAAVELNFGVERELAEKWRNDRNSKITELLSAGRHPDTDSAFWQEVDGALPEDPRKANEERSETILWVGLFGLVGLALCGGAFTLVRRGQRTS